ncbi:TlpA family protein disulfide reductase [Pedobacter kyungheensis]|uniref:TlpA family protein disulfide reductase n=1 Tax=Pedobacter kyungheensis TaxID=1069985 RepID=UPI001427BC26|nr:TlpA disulfide reductase family protein [Pedobacter kyungheensis]
MNIFLFTGIVLLMGCKTKKDVTLVGNFPSSNNAVVMVKGKAVKLTENVKNDKFNVTIKEAKAGFYDLTLEIPPLVKEEKDIRNRLGKTMKISVARMISKTIYIDPQQDISYNLKLELPRGINSVDSMPAKVFNKLNLSLDSRSYDSKVYEKISIIQRKYYYIKNSKESELNLKRDQALVDKKMEEYSALSDSLVFLWKANLVPQMTGEYRETMRENLGSIITPYLISKAVDLDQHFQEYSSIVNHLKGAAATSEYANSARERLKFLESTSIGQKLPEPIGVDPNGKQFKSNQKRARYTLIEFWASWCAPCRQNNPELLKIYTKYHNKGFNIIGVSIDEHKGAWLDAIRKDNLIWQHVSDLKSMTASQNTSRFNIVEIPNNFLINDKGIILAKDLSTENLKEKLTILLK